MSQIIYICSKEGVDSAIEYGKNIHKNHTCKKLIWPDISIYDYNSEDILKSKLINENKTCVVFDPVD